MSLNDILDDVATAKVAQLEGILSSLNRRYKLLYEQLASVDILLSIDRGNEGEPNASIIQHYRIKLKRIQSTIISIKSRMIALQVRANKVRGALPFDGSYQTLQGPFRFRCIHKTGAKYLEEPMKGSKIIDSVEVKYGEDVEILERRFIPSEESVYLLKVLAILDCFWKIY